jgi:hypothetical protein
MVRENHEMQIGSFHLIHPNQLKQNQSIQAQCDPMRIQPPAEAPTILALPRPKATKSSKSTIEPGSRIFAVCPICEKLVTSDIKEEHMREHNFKCDIETCDDVLFSKEDLQKHKVRIHNQAFFEYQIPAQQDVKTEEKKMKEKPKALKEIVEAFFVVKKVKKIKIKFYSLN